MLKFIKSNSIALLTSLKFILFSKLHTNPLNLQPKYLAITPHHKSFLISITGCWIKRNKEAHSNGNNQTIIAIDG